MYDYLIIGQGLAGATLALHLLKTGQKVMVLDNQYPKSSSRVAAGLFNAITGNKFLKTWKADVIFPYLMQFYTEAETLLQSKFFYPLPIYRPFDSIEKQNSHLVESGDSSYQNYINRNIDTDGYNKTVYNEFGGISLAQCGFLNSANYIESVRQYLIKQEAFIETEFVENHLVITNSAVSYQNIQAKKVVFCRGSKDSTSSFWSFLPFQLVKGEILYVKFENGFYDTIINRGCWILPMGNNFYKVGATYHWHILDEITTEEASKELTEKLEKLSRFPYKIIGQVAAIRPASLDRKPFIGQHPEYENMYIFNGFGAKGVSLIPYFAQHFADVLAEKTTLDKEVDINRLKKKPSNILPNTTKVKF